MIARAAAVVPCLPDGRVLVGLRTHHARSWPGTLAFPGGGCDPGDDALPLLSGERSTTRACALRELGEETGLWRLCRPNGDVDAIAHHGVVSALASGASLGAALAQTGFVLDDRRLEPLVLWKTWDGRFGVQQFLLTLDDEPPLHPVVVEELRDIAFRAPTALFAAWQHGEVFLIPPIRRVIEELARHAGDPSAQRAALCKRPTARERARHDLVAGVCVLPARTPTLPPATHTNAVLLGTGDALLVDPATPYGDEQRRFERQLRACLGPNHVSAIVCTHHHADHTGDVARLAQRLRVPVWAHEETAKRVPFAVDRFLQDDELLCSPGPMPQRFRVIFTPGHAPGHVCLFEEESRALIAGDMVAGIGSILIDPPEGHMGTYLASLAKLRALNPRAIVPSHGPVLTDGAARLDEQLAHREKRQASVLSSLAAAPGADVPAIVERVYADTPRALWPLAERSVLAALELCVERGQADTDGQHYWRP